jgi:hypothetical protein
MRLLTAPAPILVAALMLAACSSEPAEPAVEQDPDAVTEVSTWNLAGDGLNEAGDLWVHVTADTEAPSLEAWVDGAKAGTVPRVDGAFEGAVDIAGLEVGEHTLELSINGGQTTFSATSFLVSHALYVVVSVDWDQPDTDDSELAWHETLHAKHPDLRLTQLVGPYAFTDPDVSPERREYLVSWLRTQEAEFGDETGLHIHPYCSFIEAAGLPCVTDTSYVYDGGDESGYTVPLWTYTLDEQVQMLEGAIDLFEDHGLDAPTSFRAGAWMADANLLAALSETGFVAESSALNTPLIEDEWADFGLDDFSPYNNLLWSWNAEHWDQITATSQPYHPSANDAQAQGDLAVLELPDNGALADYVTTEDMVAVLEANWDGDVLDEPLALSIGFHNRTKGTDYSYRPDFKGALTTLDGYLASQGTGPVVYITMSEAAQVW